MLLTFCNFTRIITTSKPLSNSSFLKSLSNMLTKKVELTAYCSKEEHQLNRALTGCPQQEGKVGMCVNLRFSLKCVFPGYNCRRLVEIAKPEFWRQGNQRHRPSIDLPTKELVIHFCKKKSGHLLWQEVPKMIKP